MTGMPEACDGSTRRSSRCHSHGVRQARDVLERLWSKHRSQAKRFLSKPWTEVRLMSQFELAPVRLASVINEVPKGAVPDCGACMNNCCGGLENLVSLRLIDVATLIDIGRTELMSKTKPVFPPELLQAKPSLLALQESWLFQTLPVLKQVGAERRCAALTPNLECSLHPSWPTSCERFPYMMTADRKKVRWGTRCPSRAPQPDLQRAAELHAGAVAVFNERIRDAVLLQHARADLNAAGFEPFLN